MKKLVLLLLPLIAATALTAQPAAFFGEVDVKILPETLVYVDGDFEGNQTSAVQTSNEGNIQVTGGFDNSASADGTFVLEFINDLSYGQLIINNTQTVNAASKVRVEKVAFAGQDFSQIAFPFTGYTLTDFAADLTAAGGIGTNNVYVTTACSSGPCGPRYLSSMYFWNNTDRTFDHVTDANAPLDALNYYIVNNANHSISGNSYFMEGAPYTAPTANSTSVAMPAQTNFASLTDTNKWGETYDSYIEDITSARGDADFGTNLYQMANPFTSNIDLSFIGTDESATFGDDDNNSFPLGDLEAVSYVDTAAGGVSEDQRTSTFVVASADASNEFTSGDIDALIVPPAVPFLVKMTPSFSSGALNFSDFIKTFEFTARNDTNDDGNFGRGDAVTQVGINLFNANGEQESRFYVGASGNSQSAQATRMEADARESLFNANGVYTIQEALDGTINPNEESLPKYINLVNTDFREAIPVGVNVTEGSNFVLKLHLRSEGGRVLEADEQFSNGLNYYFHDKLDNTVVEITPDFEYSFTANESVIDRFQIFYGQAPAFLNTIDNKRVSETLVYSLDRTANNYAVKFSTEQLGSTADVFVYNAIGQIIFAEKNVDTANDLNLNLVANSASFYVVKIIGANGTIVSKKIVKS